MLADAADAWLADVVHRHTRELSAPEFLRAVRALSARYVERRADLGRRSPIDSAGKRAAFAGFFAPLHFVTTREIVRVTGAADRGITHLLDLGCGTGVASAAWASACRAAPAIAGVDRNRWALAEAAWNWRRLGLTGRTLAGDLVRAAVNLAARGGRSDRTDAIILAWSVNELENRTRLDLLPALLACARARRAVLVIEPLARAAAPWWDAWADAWRAAGGRSDEWKLDAALPSALADISRAAGFRREWLGARTLWHAGR